MLMAQLTILLSAAFHPEDQTHPHGMYLYISRSEESPGVCPPFPTVNG